MIMSNYMSSRRLRKEYENKNVNIKNKEEQNSSLGIRMLVSSLLIVVSFTGKEYYSDSLKQNKHIMNIYNKLKQETSIESVVNLFDEKN